jgi:hypothetical protein
MNDLKALLRKRLERYVKFFDLLAVILIKGEER